MQRDEHNIRDYLVSVLDGETYGPGARLPTEREICQRLAVSRSAVRTALALLEGEKRIVRVAGSGTYVADERAGLPTGALPLLTSPAQVMEARLTIEPQLAHLVAANGTAADFAAIQRCHDAGIGAGTMEAFETWDAALHQAIAEASRNPLLVAAYKLITSARDQGEWGALKRRSLTPERRDHYQEDHASIVAALRERDATAAEDALRQHLLRVRANLLGV